MWATIIFGSIILVAIIFIIIASKKWNGYGTGVFFMATICFSVVLIICLLGGYLFGGNLERKNELIKIYEICPCSKHLDDIVRYNEFVEENNNLFCRFNIKDMNEYLIDLDELPKKGD